MLVLFIAHSSLLKANSLLTLSLKEETQVVVLVHFNTCLSLDAKFTHLPLSHKASKFVINILLHSNVVSSYIWKYMPGFVLYFHIKIRI